MNYEFLFRLPKHLPAPVKRAATFIYYQCLFARRERDTLYIHSIPKSGTNKCKIFLANYLKIIFTGGTEKVTYREMASMFPNYRIEVTHLKPQQAPSPLVQRAGVTDVTHGHSTQFLQHFTGRMVFLYRNPLDVIISRYFYSYKFRPDQTDKVAHPRDIIDDIMAEYVHQFSFIRDHFKGNPRVLPLSYENMMEFPESTFQILVEWLGLPMSQPALSKALEYSSIDEVRAEEHAGGPIHSPVGFTGNFVRSGEIGQWRGLLESQDLERVAEHLARSQLALADFVLEPRIKPRSLPTD